MCSFYAIRVLPFGQRLKLNGQLHHTSTTSLHRSVLRGPPTTNCRAGNTHNTENSLRPKASSQFMVRLISLRRVVRGNRGLSVAVFALLASRQSSRLQYYMFVCIYTLYRPRPVVALVGVKISSSFFEATRSFPWGNLYVLHPGHIQVSPSPLQTPTRKHPAASGDKYLSILRSSARSPPKTTVRPCSADAEYRYRMVFF